MSKSSTICAGSFAWSLLNHMFARVRSANTEHWHCFSDLATFTGEQQRRRAVGKPDRVLGTWWKVLKQASCGGPGLWMGRSVLHQDSVAARKV